MTHQVVVRAQLGHPQGRSFATSKNLYNITRNVTFVAILALGMTLVNITGGIDLSVGSVLCLCCTVLAVVMNAGYSIKVGIAASVAIAQVVGAFNGILIAYLGLPPFVVTLADAAVQTSTAGEACAPHCALCSIAISCVMPISAKMSLREPATSVAASTVSAGRPDICVIANSRSGATAPVASVLERAMTVFGARAELRTFTGDPTPVAAQAIRDGFPIIVAAGGDGTVAGVAHALAGTQASMAVLPLGTFNYFARGLDMPSDAVEAAIAITQGEPHDISVGSVNGKVFLNNVALGLYPAILDEREAVYQRWGRSRILAHWSTLRMIMRLQRPMRFRIVADGQVQIRRSPMIFVARSAYQLDQFGVVGAEAISDDRFAVYIARQATRMGLLKLGWRLMRPGKVYLSDDLELLTPQTLVLDWPKRRRIRIAYDGEREKMKLPLTFRIDHQVLSVILPPTKAAVVKGK